MPGSTDLSRHKYCLRVTVRAQRDWDATQPADRGVFEGNTNAAIDMR
jgi:hypothetical protein